MSFIPGAIAVVYAYGCHQLKKCLRTMPCCRCWLATFICRAISKALPTEYLILLDRYVQQARELQILAGSSNTIRVKNCDDAGTLVQILGYRIQGCGEKTVFHGNGKTGESFWTIDSGFPLTELETALQEGTPFTYAYPASRVPVLFDENDWIKRKHGKETKWGRRSGRRCW